MELYTLRLGAPLAWTPVTAATAELEPGNTTSALGLPVLAKEGAEAVAIWTRDQLAADSEDGPQLSRPLPPPLQTGLSEASGDAATVAGRIVLPAGSYLFCQGQLDGIASIELTLEWFFREAWWTRAEYRGPVYLRLIREDGKTAVQVLMECAKD